MIGQEVWGVSVEDLAISPSVRHPCRTFQTSMDACLTEVVQLALLPVCSDKQGCLSDRYRLPAHLEKLKKHQNAGRIVIG